MKKVGELLQDDTYAKFGKNINVTEGKRFLQGHGVSMTNAHDLAHLAVAQGLVKKKTKGLAALYELLCGGKLRKDEVRTSSWGRKKLSQLQLDYAAADVRASASVLAAMRTKELNANEVDLTINTHAGEQLNEVMAKAATHHQEKEDDEPGRAACTDSDRSDTEAFCKKMGHT
jgi:ribonuclease D